MNVGESMYACAARRLGRAALAGAAIAAASALLVCGCSGPGTARSAPANRIAVLIDGSISYKSRQTEAVDRAVAFLGRMAEAKLRRWEAADDRIFVIALDAMPAVIWEGSLRELKATDRAAWTKRFQARTDYAQCTDVTAAFRLAARMLAGDPRSIRKYVLVFSDLIDEPPTDSIARCRPLRGAPADDFPWEALQGTSVSVFWLPPDQKLVWQRAVDGRGLASNFALYTTSESSEVTIAPPPRAQYALTEAEREAARNRFGMWFAIVVAGIFLALVAGVGGLVWCVRRRASIPGARLRPLPPRAPRPAPRPGARGPSHAAPRPPGAAV